MLLITLCISFVIGCIGAVIAYKLKVKRHNQELTKEIILTSALLEMSNTEYVALCTTLGTEAANEFLITNWKIKHLL